MYGPFSGSPGKYHQTLLDIAKGRINVGLSPALLT